MDKIICSSYHNAFIVITIILVISQFTHRQFHKSKTFEVNDASNIDKNKF